MKNRKILALVLALVLVFTQFSLLGVVSAETVALTGRDDFLKGVNIHPSKNYNAPYTSTYQMILDAKALGANIIRTNFNTEENHAYDLGVADLAIKNGMQVWMTSQFDFYNYETNQPIPANEIDVAGITAKYTNAATVLKDKVAYYQLGNEMNIEMHTGDANGLTADQFADCSGIAIAIYAANKAIKDVDPNAKTVVNFSWQHMGFIDAIKSVKLDPDTGLPTDSTTNYVNADWDIIGLNWYSNGTSDDWKEEGWFFADPIDYDYIIESLNQKYPDKKVVVSETGLWPIENEDGSIGYVEDAQWLEELLNYCYNNENVIGFIPYELYDQDSRSYDEEGNYSFNSEAHHGLMKNDGTKKDVYNTICSLYGGTGVVDRTIPAVPAMSNKGELKAVFSAEGATSTAPVAYSKADWLIAENNACDFSNGDLIEFDFYVEDAQALKSAMEKSDLNLMVKAYDTDGNYRDCRYITKEYILADGWNHIVVPVLAFFDYSVDWTKINKIAVQFYGSEDVIHQYSELSGMNVAIANICSTNVSAPANDIENKYVIDENGYSTPVNRVVGYYTGYQGKTFDEAIDVSECDKIEFDLYVENLDIFQKLTSEKELILKLLGNVGGTIQYQYRLSKYVTQQGWNHITINIGDYDAAGGTWNNKIARYRLHFDGAERDSISYPALYLSFRNFNAVKNPFYAVPEMVESEGMLIIHEGSKFKSQYATYNDIIGSNINYGSDQDFSQYSYFEFDYYVENLENLKQLVSKVRLNLMNSNGSSQLDYNFIDHLTKDGWNHVKIATSLLTGKAKISAIQYIRFRLNKNADVTVGTTDCFNIANICATLGEYTVTPELPANVIASNTEKVIGVYGTVMSNIKNIKTTFASPINLGDAEYIEFDLYVENAEHFHTYRTTNATVEDHKFYFYLKTSKLENGNNMLATYYFDKMSDQIKVDGWNHIKIAKGDWGHKGFSGTPDFSSVIGAGWYFERGAGNSLYTTEHIGFANVCGTVSDYNLSPKLPVNAIASNTDRVIGVYGTNMSNIKNIKTTFASPINLDNAEYIEFDLYVENAEHFHTYRTTNATLEAHKFYFYLETSKLENGKNVLATYYFDKMSDQIKVDGWNHIKIAKGDWGHKGFSGAPDFSSVIGAGWYFERGAGNSLYTTEHIGFANVCGTVDLTVPTEVMKDKIDLIGATLNQIKFDAECVYAADLEEVVNISGNQMMIELDVFVSGDALTELEVELADNAGGYVVYSFEGLTSGWNRLAIRLSDSIEGEVDFTNIAGYAFYGTANTSVIVSNFYAAAYVKGDGNRDGVLDIRDLVAMKKYAIGITIASGIVGNKVAMDVKGDDYLVNAQDLSALRCYFLTDNWPEN